MKADIRYSVKGIQSGDNSGEDTPVPISNTVVKLSSADDTWWGTAWESRTLPVSENELLMQLACGSMVKRSRHRPFTAVTRVRFSVESPSHMPLLVSGIIFVRKWLRGRASPCQGEGREFESRLPLHFLLFRKYRIAIFPE